MTLDLLGCFFLAAGLVLLLTGLSMGGPAHPWHSPETLATLIVGSLALIVFFIYEWKGTKTGILHHDLFNHGKANVRTFVICLILVFCESPMLYTMILEYPQLYDTLYLAASKIRWLICSQNSSSFRTRPRSSVRPCYYILRFHRCRQRNLGMDSHRATLDQRSSHGRLSYPSNRHHRHDDPSTRRERQGDCMFCRDGFRHGRNSGPSHGRCAARITT